MNIAAYQFPVFNPYISATFEIYVSGCKRGCYKCQNVCLQAATYGTPLDIKKLISYLKEREDLFENISILGGDLLCHSEEEILGLIAPLGEEFLNKDLWLFTGAELKDVPLFVKEWFDYIKVGCYKEELKQEGFPSSSNQMLLKKGINYSC